MRKFETVKPDLTRRFVPEPDQLCQEHGQLVIVRTAQGAIYCADCLSLSSKEHEETSKNQLRDRLRLLDAVK